MAPPRLAGKVGADLLGQTCWGRPVCLPINIVPRQGYLWNAKSLIVHRSRRISQVPRQGYLSNAKSLIVHRSLRTQSTQPAWCGGAASLRSEFFPCRLLEGLPHGLFFGFVRALRRVAVHPPSSASSLAKYAQSGTFVGPRFAGEFPSDRLLEGTRYTRSLRSLEANPCQK